MVSELILGYSIHPHSSAGWEETPDLHSKNTGLQPLPPAVSWGLPTQEGQVVSLSHPEQILRLSSGRLQEGATYGPWCCWASRGHNHPCHSSYVGGCTRRGTRKTEATTTPSTAHSAPKQKRHLEGHSGAVVQAWSGGRQEKHNAGKALHLLWRSWHYLQRHMEISEPVNNLKTVELDVEEQWEKTGRFGRVIGD